MLKLYNTLTKKLEEIPKKDHLNLYSCGPTVYNYAHIGNLRSYIMADLLYRTLKYENYNPRWVMNITDVDDKTIKGTIAKYGAGATVENLHDHTQFYMDAFLKDLDEVNVLKDEITFIRVTDVIPQIQEFILGLMEKGYAYKAEDGVYFSIEKYQKDFGDYGDLVGHKFLEGKKVGARVAVDEYEKDNLSDFALWKAWDEKTDGQIFWPHPLLGNGRPGWHIECSVINQVAFKGEPTDIHTGGVDLIFPHHTNEIAQSQALLGQNNFVHHWFHSEHLLVDGKKMAKSLNNFYTLKDLKDKGSSSLDYRYMLFSAIYRGQQNFTWEALGAAKTRLNWLRNFFHREVDLAGSGKVIADYTHKFIQALNNDLNFSIATGLISDLVKLPEFLSTLLEFDKVLGLKLLTEGFNADTDQYQSGKDVQLDSLLQSRVKAKEQKDFTKSDELRKQIEDLDYEVMDTPEGQKVKKKLNI